MIYFISNGNGAIKIGYTSNLDQRLAAFKTSMPTLKLIATMEGTQGHERSLHRELTLYRIAGEWFSDCEYVRKVMEHALVHGVGEWHSPRQEYERTASDKTAQQLVEIICEGKSTSQVDALEEAFDIPGGTIWRLRYRQNREVSAGEYFALLRAAGLLIGIKRENLQQQADLVARLQSEEASKANEVVEVEDRLRSLGGLK